MSKKSKLKRAKPKLDSKQVESRNIEHVLNGYPGIDSNWKGVEIMGGKMPQEREQEKGVEIHDPRHG